MIKRIHHMSGSGVLFGKMNYTSPIILYIPICVYAHLRTNSGTSRLRTSELRKPLYQGHHSVSQCSTVGFEMTSELRKP